MYDVKLLGNHPLVSLSKAAQFLALSIPATQRLFDEGRLTGVPLSVTDAGKRFIKLHRESVLAFANMTTRPELAAAARTQHDAAREMAQHMPSIAFVRDEPGKAGLEDLKALALVASRLPPEIVKTLTDQARAMANLFETFRPSQA